MQRFLNTLYITTQGTYLHKKGDAVEIIIGDEVKQSIPMINLDSIVCFGNIRVSPFLLGSAPEHNITISFLNEQGKFLARVQGPVAGNVLLRKAQYRISDDEEKSAHIAKYFIMGKVANQKTVLQRAIRDHKDKIDAEKVSNAISILDRNISKIQTATDLASLRGIEGDSAETYFSVFDELITSQKDGFVFTGRNRRPPLDNVNALLSFLYSFLYHDMISACEVVGLDPAVGFMHRDRPGRLSLALDLMEEFRPFFVDRLVLSLINRGEITATQFEKTASGAVNMNETARKTIVNAYQKKKETVLNHPYVEKKMYLAILMQTQVRLLARYIRGDIDGYPVYMWK